MDKKYRDKIPSLFLLTQTYGNPIRAQEEREYLIYFMDFIEKMGGKIEMVYQDRDEKDMLDALEEADRLLDKEYAKVTPEIRQQLQDIIGH